MLVLSHVCLFYDPMDCNPPASTVRGIFQARILEWVAIFSSRGSSQLRDQTRISCVTRQIVYHCATLAQFTPHLPGTLYGCACMLSCFIIKGLIHTRGQGDGG